MNLAPASAVRVYEYRVYDVPAADKPAPQLPAPPEQAVVSKQNFSFPENDVVHLLREAPQDQAPPRQAAATYRAQLPHPTYIPIFDSPTPGQKVQQPPLDRRTAASAGREYTKQLNTVAFKPGILVDSYA